MIVSELSRVQVGDRLAGAGLSIRTGPVVTRIQSRLSGVADGIALHYADHPLAIEDEFCDFHVSVDRPAGLRRWLQPQVLFRYDGAEPFAPLPAAQGFPILEWGLNWCMYSLCNQYLIFHSAVLERGGLAVILPAPSGSGKSTLCAGLAFRGWRLLSDELALIEPASGELLPLPRPISLKNHSIEVIRAFASEAVFGVAVTDTTKGTVCHVRPPPGTLAQAQVRARPRWVVFPKYAAGAPAQLKPLTRAQTFMALLEQCFNYHEHGRDGFAMLAALVEGSQGYEFSYGHLDEAVAVFDRLAEQALGESPV